MNTWDNLHQVYEQQDWINKPNIFAQEIIPYLPHSGKVLCLGDGQGQDGRYFASLGYEVISTDISEKALEICKEKITQQNISNLSVAKLDIATPFPYSDGTFDVIYAHLSVQYFNTKTTEMIFQEIYRVLKKEGICAVFVNSVNDPEFNMGKRIEQEFFEIKDKQKRFFSVFSMEHFTRQFMVLLLDDQGKTYKDESAGVHNLVRFIGKK